MLAGWEWDVCCGGGGGGGGGYGSRSSISSSSSSLTRTSRGDLLQRTNEDNETGNKGRVKSKRQKAHLERSSPRGVLDADCASVYDRFLLSVRAVGACCSFGERERERRASCCCSGAAVDDCEESWEPWVFVLRSKDGRWIGGNALWPGRRSREVLLKACANDGKDWDAAAAVLECRTDMGLVVVGDGDGDVDGDGGDVGGGRRRGREREEGRRGERGPGTRT